jgi:hypothetical protein
VARHIAEVEKHIEEICHRPVSVMAFK